MIRINAAGWALVFAIVTAVGNADELRDPTRPARLGPGIVMTSPSVEAVRLEAILNSGDARRAIVNGKVVREGERVNGVQIVAINENSIHYVRAGRGHIATLPSRKISVRGPVALHAGEP
jgi:hypothetical protein